MEKVMDREAVEKDPEAERADKEQSEPLFRDCVNCFNSSEPGKQILRDERLGRTPGNPLHKCDPGESHAGEAEHRRVEVSFRAMEGARTNAECRARIGRTEAVPNGCRQFFRR